MKLGLVLSFSLFFGQACTKGLNTSPGTDAGATTAPFVESQALMPMDFDPVSINAALAKLPPPSDAKIAELAESPAAALLLAQFSTILSTSDALNTLAADTDPNPSFEGLGLADAAPQPRSEDSLSPMERRGREVARFGNEFFVRGQHPALTKDTCPDLGKYFARVIQSNLDWKARAQGRLACIEAAKSPVFIQDCWGNSTSVETGKPYYLWTTLVANLDTLITQLTDQQVNLQNLCTTYFTENPTDTWQWSDFQAALQQAGSGETTAATNTDVSVATDSMSETQVEATNSLAAAREAISTNWQQLQTAKQAMNACMKSALPPPPRHGEHVAPAVATALHTFSSCMGAAQIRRGVVPGGSR